MAIIVYTHKSKNDVFELAKAKECMRIELDSFGAMNTPTEVEKQVEARARGAIMRSKLATATKEYERAFAQWERYGFQDTFVLYEEIK